MCPAVSCSATWRCADDRETLGAMVCGGRRVDLNIAEREIVLTYVLRILADRGLLA